MGVAVSVRSAVGVGAEAGAGAWTAPAAGAAGVAVDTAVAVGRADGGRAAVAGVVLEAPGLQVVCGVLPAGLVSAGSAAAAACSCAPAAGVPEYSSGDTSEPQAAANVNASAKSGAAILQAAGGGARKHRVAPRRPPPVPGGKHTRPAGPGASGPGRRRLEAIGFPGSVWGRGFFLPGNAGVRSWWECVARTASSNASRRSRESTGPPSVCRVVMRRAGPPPARACPPFRAGMVTGPRSGPPAGHS